MGRIKAADFIGPKRPRGRPKGAAKKAAPPVVTLTPAPPPEEAHVQAITADVAEEERAQFAALLKQKMSLEDRANQLVELARLNDTKRAPVGLRAIQEINAITGVHDPKPTETPPMFVFPENTSVSVKVEKVIK